MFCPKDTIDLENPFQTLETAFSKKGGRNQYFHFSKTLARGLNDPYAVPVHLVA